MTQGIHPRELRSRRFRWFLDIYKKKKERRSKVQHRPLSPFPMRAPTRTHAIARSAHQVLHVNLDQDALATAHSS